MKEALLQHVATLYVPYWHLSVQAEEPSDWSCDLCMNATTALDEYPPNFECARVEEESLEESGEPLFSDEATLGECF